MLIKKFFLFITFTFCLMWWFIIVPQAKSECKDDDNGINLNKKGVVSYGSNYRNKTEDFCFNYTNVQESFCYDGDLALIGFKCSTSCNEGKCVKDTKVNFSCTDSDGGSDISKAGIVESNHPIAHVHTESVWSGKKISFKDSCANERQVNEYYCHSDKSAKSKPIDCPKDQICLNGYCQKPPANCTDTDGGKNPDVFGKVTDSLGVKGEDVCEPGTTNKVRELYCSTAKKLTSEVMTCKTGYICQQGACVLSKKSCTDTDGGEKINIKGVATNELGKESTDYCISGSKLKEYFCTSSKEVSYKDINCPYNQICLDGACINYRSIACLQPLSELDYLKGFSFRDNLINFAFENISKKSKIESLVNQIVQAYGNAIPVNNPAFGGFGTCIWKKMGNACQVYSGKLKQVVGSFGCSDTKAGSSAMAKAVSEGQCCSKGVECQKNLNSYEYLSGFGNETLKDLIAKKDNAKLERLIDQVVKQFGAYEFDIPNVYAPLAGNCTWMEHWETKNCYIFGYKQNKKISGPENSADGICGLVSTSIDNTKSLGDYSSNPYLKYKMKKLLLDGMCC